MFNCTVNGMWLSLVERRVRNAEVAGSNPVIPTMFFVYILDSLKSGRYYVGFSDCPGRRLQKHNSGRTTSTKSGMHCEKLFEECYETPSEAMVGERQINSWKSRRAIEELIAER